MSNNKPDQRINPFIHFFFHDEETISKFKNLRSKGDKISQIWETPFIQVKRTFYNVL